MKTENKTLITLHIGKFIAHVTFMVCRNCNEKKVFVSSEPWELVPQYCNFGFDVMVEIGKKVFLQYRPAHEIVEDLTKKNVFLSESEVYFLTKKFVTYLSTAHCESGPAIRKYIENNGGYILHIDGTCDGGSPHLIAVIDVISGFVLDSIKIPTENSGQIIPMLKNIKEAYGIPLAIVSDMGSAISLAVKTVFKGVVHLVCHFHFLRDLGKDLFTCEYSVIRKQLTAHGVSAKLQRRIHSYEEETPFDPKIIEPLISSLATNDFSDLLLSGKSIKEICHILLLWAFRGKSQCGAYGFPFDRQHLVFYQRLTTVYEALEGITNEYPKDLSKDIKVALQLMNDLEPLLNDSLCKQVLPGIVEKIEVFDKLRDAMRMALPDGNNGLNDNGDDSDIKTIEKRVKKFNDWLIGKYSNKKDYKKMFAQIEKYWEKLFADPITVHTPAGEIKIQPQRTNNIMEQFFRRIKNIFIRKSGNNSMSDALRTMLNHVPLIKNLENSDYMSILLNGKNTLEERFSEIDSEKIRKEMKKNCNHNEKIPKKIEKLINNIQFPNMLKNIFKFRLTG
ncbi:MAG: transposase [Flavobacteriaceae bacterium]|nr:transposase [Flavobacteriaceae bacterium]